MRTSANHAGSAALPGHFDLPKPSLATAIRHRRRSEPAAAAGRELPLASIANGSRHLRLYTAIGIAAAILLTAGAFAAMALDVQRNFQADPRGTMPSRPAAVLPAPAPEPAPSASPQGSRA
jgi:hypothetical protein